MKKIINKIKGFFRRFKKKPIAASSNVNFIDVENKEKETNVLDVDLIDHNISEKSKKKVRQYTKIIVTVLISMAIIWISWSYVLATVALINFGTFQPLMSLSQQVCITILGVCTSYFVKSYFETWSEKKNEMLMNQINCDTESASTDMVNNYDDAPVAVTKENTTDDTNAVG